MLEAKQSKIFKAEEDKTHNNEYALKEKEDLNSKALEDKEIKNATAEAKREKTRFDVRIEKETAEVEAKERKETSDETIKEIKAKEDEVNESRKTYLYHQYEKELQQLNENSLSIEKRINNDCQENLRVIDENILYLKERIVECTSAVEANEERRMKAIQKICQLMQEIKDGEDLSKEYEVSIECLLEADKALCNIQTIMRNTSKFWKGVEVHCRSMTEKKMMKLLDSLTRHQVWSGDTFKEAALQYEGQWSALKDFCAKASEHITSVQKEIHQYVYEDPTKESTLKLLQRLQSDIFGSDTF